jgi:hypothetical protein
MDRLWNVDSPARRVAGAARWAALAALLGVTGACASSKVEVAEAQAGDSTAVVGEAANGGEAEAPAAAPAALNFDSLVAARTLPEALHPAPDPADSAAAAAPAKRYLAGTDPAFAMRMGWPVDHPIGLEGAILPHKRIVAYYGNPNSTRMGALGEYPKDEMLRRLKDQIAAWQRADPETPIVPALHMVSVVAQGEAGTSGHYRSIMRDADVQKVYDWAKEIDGIFFVDIQVGHSDIRELLPRFEWILKNPDVHLAIDPEFMLTNVHKPGTKIGTMDAADINYASEYLAKLVQEHNLPPKVLVIHRFTRNMVTNSKQIKLRPEVQIVMDMDGWGAPWLKRDSYRDYIVKEPVEYTGFKLFYHNDTKKGDPLMSPADVLDLRPIPLYIQYQ